MKNEKFISVKKYERTNARKKERKEEVEEKVTQPVFKEAIYAMMGVTYVLEKRKYIQRIK